MTVEQEMINIELKREAAVKMMAEHIQEKLGSKGEYTAEALFYCSENNYEYIKARDAFNADNAFERKERMRER